MVNLLYFLASVILIHKVMLVYSVTFSPIKGRHPLLSGLVAIAMIVLIITAISLESWPVLVLAFAGYVLYNMIDASWIAIRNRRPPSPYLPVYALIFASSVISYQLNAWRFFTFSYGVYWIASLILGKKMLNRSIQSQKI
ncbi:MAG: hypothetical protein R3C61_10705 [Bacteroidia bacterium]